MFSCRLDKPNMNAIQEQSTLWRITCGFPKYGVDYRDYIRGKNSVVNILVFSGSAVCFTVEYVDIRGLSCSMCTVSFYQSLASNIHIDSRTVTCYFKPSDGSVENEDNFGNYHAVNPAFRCTENENGTTQVWFGEKFN